MDSPESDAYIRVSGLSIYSGSATALTPMLPFTVSVQIDDGQVFSYTSADSVSNGAYSPSGNWMPYFVYLTSGTQMQVPTGGEEFDITVTITPADEGTTVTFTESCCGPIANTVVKPNSMVTGTAYEFIAANAFPVDEHHVTSTSFSWRPLVDGAYIAQITESGYCDPYTKTDDAVSDFSSFYFAVANPDTVSRLASEYSTVEATIHVRTRYITDDFTNGIMITDLTMTVPITPRSEIDSSLKPTLTSNMINVVATPLESVINDKYVHMQTTLTFTPAAGYKYGDSAFYIHMADGSNRFTPSVSFPAVGVSPGTEYVRPDTGTTVVAGDESVGSTSMSVVGSKWKLESDTVTVTYPVLYYHVPRLDTFTIHRCTTSAIATDYLYNGTYYKKDDFGAYCLIEYNVSFVSLDSENECSMVVQYGTHRAGITPTSGTPGYIVVSANTQQTMDVTIFLYDLLTPYGVAAQLRLSTANVLIDFLANGKGMAIGKNATVQNALDIANGWSLLFYQALVGAYNGDTSVDLVPWMHNVDSRLTALENSPYAN